MNLTIHHPLPMQVVQRSGNSGAIRVSGLTNTIAPVTIEARVTGGAWQVVETFAEVIFDGTISAPVGQYTVEVRAQGYTPVVSVPHVSVGDVYVIAGQSNAYGLSAINVIASHPTWKLPGWLETIEWQDAALRNEYRRSYWPWMADRIMQDQGVPVGLVQTAQGGTMISQWEPGGTLYTRMVARALGACEKVKAVLWHLGETDAIRQTPKVLFRRQLETVAEAVAADLGVPVIPCLLQQTPTASRRGAWFEINAAIEEAWGHGNILAGPDFRDLRPDDGRAHLQREVTLRPAADRYYEVLRGHFYS